jgi:hypothetical protein
MALDEIDHYRRHLPDALGLDVWASLATDELPTMTMG